MFLTRGPSAHWQMLPSGCVQSAASTFVRGTVRSGVGPDYVAGVSDLNLVVVLTHIERATLVGLRAHCKAWHKLRVATPLVIEEAFLRAAADVFPMELHDIKDGHRLLAGRDVFAALEIHVTTCLLEHGPWQAAAAA
jgi:hypothetical protein